MHPGTIIRRMIAAAVLAALLFAGFLYIRDPNPDRPARIEDASDKLDWVVAMCEKYGLYAILALHGAVGSQNMDFHSGDDRQLGLFGDEKNMQTTCDLWSAIAQHYRRNATVAAYDLLNEPRCAPHRYGGKVTFDGYDRLYHAVREADPDHMIMIECFTFPIHGARREGYGWSFTSWTYKTNDLQVQRSGNKCNWGLYGQQIEPVDLSTASYEEIADTYARTVSKEEERTIVYEMWKAYLQK